MPDDNPISRGTFNPNKQASLHGHIQGRRVPINPKEQVSHHGHDQVSKVPSIQTTTIKGHGIHIIEDAKCLKIGVIPNFQGLIKILRDSSIINETPQKGTLLRKWFVKPLRITLFYKKHHPKPMWEEVIKKVWFR